MQDRFFIYRKVGNEIGAHELSRHATLEEAEAEVNDFRRFAWRNNEEIVICRVSFHPVVSVKAHVQLDRQLK